MSCRLISLSSSLLVTAKLIAPLTFGPLGGISVGQSPPATAGSFRILSDGKPAGWEKFEMIRAGEVLKMKSSGELRTQGSVLTLNTVTEIRNGAPASYSVDAAENGRLRRYAITFRGGAALVAIEAGGRRSERAVRLSKDVVVLDPNVWHQYSQLIAKYNRQRGGKQLFRVFMPRAGLREVSALVELTGKTDFGSGRDKRKADRFVVELARSAEVRITADEEGAVLSLELRDLGIKVLLE